MYVYVCMYVYVYMYVCIYIYIYIYIYIRGGLMILSRRPFLVVRLREYCICFYLASRGPPSKLLCFFVDALPLRENTLVY